MSEQSIRHVEPVAVKRTRGARRLIAYSPKLNRRVQLHSRAAFDLWLVLEGDPNIVHFCERPIRLLTVTGERVIDFWSCEANSEYYWCLGEAPEHALEQAMLRGVPIRYVPLPQLAADEQWARNWQKMLPVITAHADNQPIELDALILCYTEMPQALMQIEREFAVGEPSSVRASVFRLLHTGQLMAPTLRTRPLSLLTEFQATHATTTQ